MLIRSQNANSEIASTQRKVHEILPSNPIFDQDEQSSHTFNIKMCPHYESMSKLLYAYVFTQITREYPLLLAFTIRGCERLRLILCNKGGGKNSRKHDVCNKSVNFIEYYQHELSFQAWYTGVRCFGGGNSAWSPMILV